MAELDNRLPSTAFEDPIDPQFAQRARVPGSTHLEDDSCGDFGAPRTPLFARTLGFVPDDNIGPAPIPLPARRPTRPGDTRPLTRNERDATRSLFGDAVDCQRVKVHNGEFLPFGWQPDDVAMTPNGELYFNPKHFKEDFALSSFGDLHWFMHEMVHVWQHQLGYPVMLRGALRIGLSYEYVLSPGKHCGDYNMEAQGNLLSDYWAVKNFARPPQMWNMAYINDRPLFETVLKRFIADPSDKANLP